MDSLQCDLIDYLYNYNIALTYVSNYTHFMRKGQSNIIYPQILCLGLTANVLRFLYISWLTNPWWVLPFELIQGK